MGLACAAVVAHPHLLCSSVARIRAGTARGRHSALVIGRFSARERRSRIWCQAPRLLRLAASLRRQFHTGSWCHARAGLSALESDAWGHLRARTMWPKSRRFAFVAFRFGTHTSAGVGCAACAIRALQRAAGQGEPLLLACASADQARWARTSCQAVVDCTGRRAVPRSRGHVAGSSSLPGRQSACAARGLQPVQG